MSILSFLVKVKAVSSFPGSFSQLSTNICKIPCLIFTPFSDKVCNTLHLHLRYCVLLLLYFVCRVVPLGSGSTPTTMPRLPQTSRTSPGSAMTDRGTTPFAPLKQLMGVFPASSGKFLPLSWRELMRDVGCILSLPLPLPLSLSLSCSPA